MNKIEEKLNYLFEFTCLRSDSRYKYYEYLLQLNSPKFGEIEEYIKDNMGFFIYLNQFHGKYKNLKIGIVKYLVCKNLDISSKNKYNLNNLMFQSLWKVSFDCVIDNMIKHHMKIKLDKINPENYPINYAIDNLLNFDINEDIGTELLFSFQKGKVTTVENSFKKGIAEYYLCRIYSNSFNLDKELFLDHFEKCILSLEETFPSQDMFDDPDLYWKNFFLANYAFFIIYKLKNQFVIENGAIFNRQVKITEFAIWEKRQKEKGLHPLFKSNF